MKIVDFFTDKMAGLIEQSDQKSSEALVELATFFYKVDRRISLEEQDYIANLLKGLPWDANLSKESFQMSCIGRINDIVDAPDDDVFKYLAGLMESFESSEALEKAQRICQEISDSDGEIADDEVKYLDFVKSFK